MDKETLRKVQLVQLEIAREIKRVCEENGITYFLTAGTLLGAVRHQGFIPWDDDLDIAMLKEDYDRFIKIAPEKLNEKYEIQNWHTDSNFPLEFSKIRKKGTVFIEGKGSDKKDNGIYVDVIVYINYPDNKDEIISVHRKMLNLHRVLLMKCGFKPWYDNGHTNWKKRIGYVWYQMQSLFKSYEKLVKEFEAIQNQFPNTTENLHGMTETEVFSPLKRVWYHTTIDMKFEDEFFPVPVGYKNYLKVCYGDYMKLPPENKRENRHQIIDISFGD